MLIVMAEHLICCNAPTLYPFALPGTKSRIPKSYHRPCRFSRLIEEVKPGLICAASTREQRGGKTVYGTQTCCEAWTTLLENHPGRLGEALVATHDLIVPADATPSSPSTFKGYPFYRWYLRIVTRIAGSPDYRGDFPTFITAPAPAPASSPT
jgi:hypothetical protein